MKRRTPRDVNAKRIAAFRTELAAARGQFQTAGEWRDFGDWHNRLSSFLHTEFEGEWPFTHFAPLSFRAPGRRVSNSRRLAPPERVDSVRCFARGCAAADELLGELEIKLDEFYIVEDATRTRPEPLGSSSLTIHAHESAIQIGTTESSQHHSKLAGPTSTLVGRLRAGLAAERRAEVQPLLEALSRTNSDSVVESLVGAIANVVGHDSHSTNQALQEWRSSTGRTVAGDPNAIPLEIVSRRLLELRNELAAAEQSSRTADEWREFHRWYDETLTILTGAFGEKSWQRMLFASVEFRSPSSSWKQPEPRPRGVLGGIGRSFEQVELEGVELAANQRYFSTAIPRALRVFEDVLSSLATAGTPSQEQK